MDTWHPKPEDLARLVDEPPTEVEAEHLAQCELCAGELEAMRQERDALGALPRILPVPTGWETMRARLDREGLLDQRRTPRTAWLPGIAAALALFLAGGATGAVLTGGTADRRVTVASDPSVTDDATTTTEAAPGRAVNAVDQAVALRSDEGGSDEGRSTAARSAQGDTAPTASEEDLPSLYAAPAGARPVQVATDWKGLARQASRADTPEEAARFVRDAEDAYMAAMTRLAELTGNSTADAAVRLATLDGIVVTTGAALERSPADPVINGYHLAARAQRDALLRTVSSTPQREPWY